MFCRRAVLSVLLLGSVLVCSGSEADGVRPVPQRTELKKQSKALKASCDLNDAACGSSSRTYGGSCEAHHQGQGPCLSSALSSALQHALTPESLGPLCLPASRTVWFCGSRFAV